MNTITPNEAKLILSLLDLYDAVYDSGLSDEDEELSRAFDEAGDHSASLYTDLKAKAKLVIANHS